MNNITQIDKLIYSPSEASRILGFKLMKQKDPELYRRWNLINAELNSSMYKKTTLSDLAQIKTLYINDYSDVVFDNLPLLKNLKHLSVVRINYIHSLPMGITKLKNLETLYFCNTEATELPEEIGNMTNLDTLCLSNNKLNTIPHTIGNLKKLNTLVLTNNNLSELPSQMENLSKLEILRANYNLITTLDLNLQKLPNLRLLYLNDNNLSEIPKGIKESNSISELLLGSNLIKEISAELVNIKTLKYMNLYNNLFIEDDIPAAIKNHPAFDFEKL